MSAYPPPPLPPQGTQGSAPGYPPLSPPYGVGGGSGGGQYGGQPYGGPQDPPRPGGPGYDPYAPQGGMPPYVQYAQQQYAAPLPGQPGYQWGAGPGQYAFAGFGARLGAALLDGLILGIPLSLVYFAAIGLFVGGLNATTDAAGEIVDANPNGAVLGIGGLLFVIVLLVAFLYEPLMTARKGSGNGQTIGKRIVGIRVVNLQTGPITAGQAWGRYLFKAFVSGSVFYLGFLWALWDTNQQTWHDKIVNTVVVKA